MFLLKAIKNDRIIRYINKGAFMKGIKRTLKLAKMVIKLCPFYLVYSLFDIILGLILVFIPIGIVQVIIDYYNNGEEFIKVLIACGLTTVLYYTIQMIYYYFNKLYRRYQRRFISRYEIMIFNKLKEIDYEKYQSSEFLNDYNRAIDEGGWASIDAFWTLSDIISSVAKVIMIFTIFALVDYLIILYALGVGVIYFFLIKYVAQINWQMSQKNKKHVRERAYVKRMFYLKDASFDIRTSQIDDLLLQANDKIGDHVIKNVDKTLSKSAIITFLSEILIRSIYPLALGFISYITLKSMDFGSFVALTVAASTLSNIIWGLSDSLASFEVASVRGETVFAIMNQQGVIEISGIKEAPTLEKITVKKLYFSYGETKVLEDINLTITKGDKIAVVGENGAGKTTFVKMLLRLYDPQSGDIYFNDESYTNLKPDSIRKKIGAVFQDFQVYSFSITENILLRKCKTKKDEELVVEALKFSGLYEKAMSFPKGLETVITKEFDQEGIELSGGEKQKLAIARAYAGNYDFIILDEPSSALDPIAEAEIYEKMMKLGKDRTLLFISHRLSTTVKANKIYLFSEGKVIEEGTHHELMQKEEGQYQYMFSIQARNYLNGVKDNEDI